MRARLIVLVLSVLLVNGCREEVVVELEQYGVKREWIPFADKLGFGDDPNYHQQYIENSFPWFFTQVTASPFTITSTSEAKSGKHALKLVNSTQKSESLWLARNENMEDLLGHRVRFSAWLKPVKWTGKVEIGCPTKRMMKGEEIDEATQPHAIAEFTEGKWSQIYYDVDIIPATEFLMPTLEFNGSGTLYLDDCSLKILGPSSAGLAVRNTPAEHRNLGFEDGDHAHVDRYEVRDSVELKIFSWSPSYWMDEYKVVLDSVQPHGGRYCAGFTSLSNSAPNDATLYVNIPPEHSQAHRMKFSVWIKPVDLKGVVTFAVSASGGKEPVSTVKRLWDVQGTTEWKQYTLELDVPKEARYCWLGVGYIGKGTMLVDDMSYERVKRLPFTTDYVDKSQFFAKPLNMDFETP